MTLKAQFTTHAVENQPSPVAPHNAWLTDGPLREGVIREGGAWAAAHLEAFGEVAGGEMMALGVVANEFKPRLRSFDRYGHRIDELEFHPAYHQVMAHSMRFGVHSFAWRNQDKPGAHVARAALMYMGSQAEAGTSCPLTMTYAAVPALRHAPALAAEWLPKITALEYDPRSIAAGHKTSCTVGMGMTEKQGGSDVRANTTRATRQRDGSYELVGHKWFFSAPQSDAHLVLAQADGGLSCFLVPRYLSNGERNAIAVQRLKDKLGDWSNASSEVEFLGAQAALVGQEGRGVATILEMVALTRQDCMIGSAALMRQAVVQALHHAHGRRAFGRLLADQPLMRNVLADLALESEAAIALTLRVSRAIDASGRDVNEAAFARIATAIGKYWICKRCVPTVNEAQECLGGAGYVEENILPRLYRQAPLNSIWEGSGNVQCLDVLRALRKDAGCAAALFRELEAALGMHPMLDREIGRLKQAFSEKDVLEVQSRRLVERTALALQASLLLRAKHTAIGEAYCQARLSDERAFAFGTLSAGAPLDALIERAVLQHAA